MCAGQHSKDSKYTATQTVTVKLIQSAISTLGITTQIRGSLGRFRWLQMFNVLTQRRRVGRFMDIAVHSLLWMRSRMQLTGFFYFLQRKHC